MRSGSAPELGAQILPRDAGAQRRGRNLNLSRRLSLRLHAPSGVQFASAGPVLGEIEQSRSAKVLEEFGCRRTLVIELPFPDAAAAPQRSDAVEALKKAHTNFIRGEYRDAVADCREALEHLAHAMGDPQQNLQLSAPATNRFASSTTQNLTKPERVRLIRHATRTLTHPAHHAGTAPNPNVPHHDWTRVDARSHAVRRY